MTLSYLDNVEDEFVEVGKLVCDKCRKPGAPCGQDCDIKFEFDSKSGADASNKREGNYLIRDGDEIIYVGLCRAGIKVRMGQHRAGFVSGLRRARSRINHQPFHCASARFKRDGHDRYFSVWYRPGKSVSIKRVSVTDVHIVEQYFLKKNGDDKPPSCNKSRAIPVSDPT